MLKHFFISALVLGIGTSACSSSQSDDDDDDGGGSGGEDTGSGGTGGGSGSGGSAGKAQVIAPGPRPFPQNKTSPFCQITSVANASTAVQSAYNSWKAAYVVSVGNGQSRVKRPDQADDTVSEGIAYGMLAALYMNERPLFDSLWLYAKSHADQYGFMHWRINADGSVHPEGMGSAADADEDMAWALIMASAQWQSSTYLDEGRVLANKMFTYQIGGDGMLLPGDGWGATDRTFPDYFSPAYYRVFARPEVTGNRSWETVVIDKNYEILAAVSGTYGLVPDSTTRTYQHMGAYGYDACRTPWRIAMDYCYNGEPRAKAYLDKIAPFFLSQGVSNIGDGYSLDGMKTSSFANMAFIGPAGVAGMAGYPQLLNDAFTYGATGTGGTTQYYQQSLRVITMLMMSGNFLDFTKTQ